MPLSLQLTENFQRGSERDYLTEKGGFIFNGKLIKCQHKFLFFMMAALQFRVHFLTASWPWYHVFLSNASLGRLLRNALLRGVLVSRINLLVRYFMY